MKIITDDVIQTLCPACRRVIDFGTEEIDIRKKLEMQCPFCGEILIVLLTFQVFTMDMIVSNAERIAQIAAAEKTIREERKLEITENVQSTV